MIDYRTHREIMLAIPRIQEEMLGERKEQIEFSYYALNGTLDSATQKHEQTVRAELNEIVRERLLQRVDKDRFKTTPKYWIELKKLGGGD